MFTRALGRSGIEVSAMGMGCWAIGGPWWLSDGRAMGWSKVGDADSIRAIHAALDMGVSFFDTAANYGFGHSERAVPIPGFKTVAQVQENARAIEFGPLDQDQTDAVERILNREQD
jgi:aryl-alcohol dehydrogenase-like predicted oxidoreductase